MKKKRGRIIVVLLLLIILTLSLRPVFWSMVGCLNEAGYGTDISEAFERFPVHMKKYTIKYYGEIMPQKKIMNIIPDESEDYKVRVMAISKLPSDDESVEFLSDIFWEVDEDISYRILKRLWAAGTPVAEDIADIILTDYEKYSPQKICAALIAKKQALLENNRGRSEEELSDEVVNFRNILSDIRENYDEINKIDRNCDSYTEAYDPVIIAGYVFNEIGL